jgi:hypothetical protein
MTTWIQTRDRITREAIELKPLKVLITILAAPFFLIGCLIGLIWFVFALAWQAGWVGVKQVRSSLTKS